MGLTDSGTQGAGGGMGWRSPEAIGAGSALGARWERGQGEVMLESVWWPGNRARAGFPLVLGQPGHPSLTYIPRGPGASESPGRRAPGPAPVRCGRASNRPSAPWAWVAAGGGRGPRTDSLVRKGLHMVGQLPRDTLQDGAAEARVAQHVALAGVDRHHLDAVFRAGVPRPVHLWAERSTAGSRRGVGEVGLGGGGPAWTLELAACAAQGIKSPPTPRTSPSQPPVVGGRWDMTLFGGKVFAGVIKDLEVRSFWI